MSAVDGFLREVEARLHLRGRSQRRVMAELRDHLAESSAVHGPEEAVRRFGRAADLAAGFDLEVAVRRSLRATAVTVAGVLAMAASALAMLNAADAHASAPVAWAVVFFGCAQASAASLALAVLRAAAMRDEVGTPADVALLCRRNAMALAFAFLTPFAVGAGVTGQTAAWKVMVGPVVAMVAAAGVARVCWFARQLDGHSCSVVRDPWADAAALTRRLAGVHAPDRAPRPAVVVAATVVLATGAAFAWDLLDHGTVAGSGFAAGIEAAMVLGGFVVLGRTLGLHAPLGRRL